VGCGSAGQALLARAQLPEHQRPSAFPIELLPSLNHRQESGVMDFAFAPTEFHDVPAGLFLQPILASMYGSSDSQMRFCLPTPV